MKAKYDCVCCYCKEKILKGDNVFYISGKYKIQGEELCEGCQDKKAYSREAGGVG